MLSSTFNSQKFLRSAGAIQLIAICCTVQPTSAQAAANAVVKTSTIVIDTDDACRLSVDGSDEGLVTPDQAVKIKVGPGGHVLKCVIEKAPDLVWRTVIETKSGEQAAALISLKALRIQYDQATRPAEVKKGDEVIPGKSAAEKPKKEEEQEQFPQQKLFAALQGFRWVREDVEYPGQSLLETRYTDVITFTSLHDNSINAHITKLTHSTGDQWQSDFSMKFAVRASNQLVQDGGTTCIQRLHNGKPDPKLPCSTWKNKRRSTFSSP